MTALSLQSQFSEFSTYCTISQSDSPSAQSPTISQSPPFTPTSSDDSFDLFSEDIFNPDWSNPKVPFGFLAIFFCLLLFSPSSMVHQPLLPGNSQVLYPSETPNPVFPMNPSETPKPVFTLYRHLLNSPQDRTNYMCSDSSTSGTIITIEDVLEDEFVSRLQSPVKSFDMENSTTVEKSHNTIASNNTKNL